MSRAVCGSGPSAGQEPRGPPLSKTGFCQVAGIGETVLFHATARCARSGDGGQAIRPRAERAVQALVQGMELRDGAQSLFKVRCAS